MTAGVAAVFSKEQSEFVITNRPLLPLRELVKQTNARFQTNFTRNEIINHCRRQGAKLHMVRFVYTQEQIDFLKIARAKFNQTDMARAFNEKFGTNIKCTALVQTCTRHGFKSEKKGGFEKGHQSWCKGKKGLKFNGSEKGQFKKGHALNAHPLGYERISTDGFIAVKISDEPYKQNFRYKHHLVWEQHNGEIPQGHCIVFKDGKKQNCNIENLKIVNKAQLSLRNLWGMQDYPPELQPTIDVLIELKMKTKAALKKKRSL